MKLFIPPIAKKIVLADNKQMAAADGERQIRAHRPGQPRPAELQGAAQIYEIAAAGDF